MVVPDTMNPTAWLAKQPEAEGGTDLIRGLRRGVRWRTEASAPTGENRRAGELPQRLRSRAFDTRADSMTLAIPELREGGYFPEWIVQPRRRAEPGPGGGGGPVLCGRA